GRRRRTRARTCDQIRASPIASRAPVFPLGSRPMNNADTIIAALRSGYDSLAGLVSGYSDQQLAGPTGADEWDVSQVLSHLGSGAEIAQNGLHAALEHKPGPGVEFNKTVWARYDEAGPRERRGWF